MSSQSIRWLHISDAHFLSLAGYDQNRLANSLVASIPNLTKRFGDIDLIIFSGDVGNTGRQEEYSQATEFFSNILSACGLEKDRLVIVPGNHDVDRRGSTGLARSLTSRGEIDELFNGRDVPHITQRQAAFATWLQEFFEGERSLSQTSTVQSQVCLNIRGQKVSIWPINTAAFSFDEHDHGRLIIGLRCLEESALRAGEADLTIAVMHHPLSWLSDIERTPVTAMLRDNVDLILHGHLHENEVQLDSGSAGQAATLTAGATYQGSEWPNTASICEITDCALSVWPIHYVAKPREVWTLDTSLFPESESFSGQFQLSLKKMRSSSFSVVKQGPASNLLTTNVATSAWRGQLFTTPEGAALYVDPRLVLNQGAQASPAEDETVPISIADVVSSRESYIIESRPEYGGTLTLARLKEELEAAGEHVFQAHASSTPNYKSKLVEALTQATSTTATNIVVLLDGFEVERDQRLVSELKKTGLVSRMIVVSTNRSLNPTTDFEIEKMAFELNRLQLRPLGRAEIRKLCSIFFPHSGDESVATITGKVYDDLLALCIPLTPANVIMYLRILHAEGSYSPINRVDILDRFLTESLRRPSDSYTGAFNYKNKSDLAAAFSMQMFTEKRETFTDRYWYEFCDAFKRETLFEFVSKDLLDEFTGARIFARLGDTVFFRYSFFFTFFLGRALSQHPGLLETFLDDQMYLSATDALDVVSSFRPNDPTIIDALSKQLESKLDDFAEAVCRRDFDPLLGAVWAPSDKEDELLWTPVANAIESAPRDTNEIDKLKSSYLAEKRTEDQTLRIKKFLELEYALFITEYSLCDVFKNCNDVGRDRKLNAYELLLRTSLAAFQVGTVFAPVLARSKYYQWGSIAFVNFDVASQKLDPASKEGISNVVTSLAQAVAEKSASQLGIIKLAGVSSARRAKLDEVTFLDVLNFAHIIGAKGDGWDRYAQSILERTSQAAYYLFVMLNVLLTQLDSDVVKATERAKLKQLVAFVRAKRGYATMRPKQKQIQHFLDTFEQQELIDKVKGTSAAGANES